MQVAGTTLALAEWGFANLVLAGLAVLIWRPLRLGCPRLDLVVLGFLWVYLSTLTVLVFGFFGILAATPIFVASLLASPLLVWAWRTGRLRLEFGSIRERLGTARWKKSQRYLAALFGLLATLQALRLGLHVWYLAPHVWDTLAYHLPNVAEWIQRERITTFDTPVTRTFWPANHALLQTWFAVFPHHDFMIEAAGLPSYLLAIGCVYSIGRSLRLRRAVAAFVALAFAYTPAVVLHATSCNNDLPIAAAFLMILAILADWRERGTDAKKRVVVIWLVAALAFGTKPYIVFIAPGLLVLAWWSWRGRPRPATPLPNACLPRPLLGFAAASGLVIAGFWYVRNLVEFGNPFYPVDFRLFGTVIFGSGGGLAQQGSFSLTSLGKSLGSLVEKRIFDNWGPYSADLTWMAGWGWFGFACGLPALAWGVITQPALRWWAIAFVLSLMSVLSWVTPDQWNLRFAMWFPAVLALAFGLVVSRLAIAPTRVALYALALVCLALNLIGTLNASGYLTTNHWRRITSLPLSERSTAAQGLYIGPTYLDALRTVPEGEPIGYCVGGNGWVYPLYGADLSRRIRYVPIAAGADIPLLMKERGVRCLFACSPPPQAERAILEAVKKGQLRKIRDDLYVPQN